jgi:hypothetical protein
MRRRWGFRGWAIVWAVLQFALPAAATYADARLERDASAAQVAHVESGSSDGCRPVHPAECALCQLVSRGSAPTASAPSWRDVAGIVEQPPIEELAQCATDGLQRSSLARAPPVG